MIRLGMLLDMLLSIYPQRDLLFERISGASDDGLSFCYGQTFLFVGTIRKCLHRFGAVWWVRTDTRTLTYVCVRTRVALTLRVIPKAALLNCDSPVCSQRVR